MNSIGTGPEFGSRAGATSPDRGQAAWRWLRRLPRRGVVITVVAVVVVVALVVSVALLRASAVRTFDAAGRQHEAGDCERALATIDSLGPVRRLAHPGVAASADAEAGACRSLLGAQDAPWDEAADRYATYLDDPRARWAGAAAARGDALLAQADRELRPNGPKAMAAGFGTLATALDENPTPDQADHAREIAAGFVDRIYGATPCEAKKDHAWVQRTAREESWDDPDLTEPVVAKRDARGNLVLGCAKVHRDADELKAAAANYRDYIQHYPQGGHRQAAQGQLAVVETEIERRQVTRIVQAGTYCRDPQAFRGAPAYRGGGTNRMIVQGLNPGQHKFPRSWYTSDVDEASLVVCVKGPGRGAYQDTCDYEDDTMPAMFGSSTGYSPVRFYATRFTVTAYSLRTGKQVARFTRDLGQPCPAFITFTTFSPSFAPNPDTYRSKPTSGEIRGMFTGLTG
jgi:hypothetical protein